LGAVACLQYRQQFADQDIVVRDDFAMLRMEDLLEVGLQPRDADALAGRLSIH
jgi:hypothetical protein